MHAVYEAGRSLAKQNGRSHLPGHGRFLGRGVQDADDHDAERAYDGGTQPSQELRRGEAGAEDGYRPAGMTEPNVHTAIAKVFIVGPPQIARTIELC